MTRPRAALVGAVASVLLAGAGAGALAGCGADDEPPATTPSVAQTQPPTGTLGATTTTPDAGDGTSAQQAREARLRPPLAFHVRRRAQLRAAPGGRVVATIKTKTEFKSPTILAVAGRKPGWVLVRTSVAKHHVGWLPTGSGVLFSQPRTIVVDLSKRTLTVFHRGRAASTFRVAIGTPSTPTPRGKFAVTDRLTTGDAAGPYGCCILALNGRQSKIAQGWGGGDRIAIHATPATWTIGKRVSHGCVRGTNKALRRLMRQVRLGTPVTIHA
jgi:lipoprotein-anchoring transpeptidase ErfK/SrfK